MKQSGFGAQPRTTRHDVSGVVKWYNPTKGFGFVQLDDGSPDAFLHASVVERAGHRSIEQGATIVCDLAEGQRGLQVADISRVDPPEPGQGGYGGDRGGFGGNRGFGESRGYGENRGYGDRGGFGGGASETVIGTVKFFNVEKGFGFVTPDQGDRDVFVSATTLSRAGIANLAPDQRVRLEIRMGQKGPMADSVELV